MSYYPYKPRRIIPSKTHYSSAYKVAQSALFRLQFLAVSASKDQRRSNRHSIKNKIAEDLMMHFQLFIGLNCAFNLSLRCGPPLMIARYVALPRTPKINLSVSIFIQKNSENLERKLRSSASSQV